MPHTPDPATESIHALSRFFVGETSLQELLSEVAERGRQAVGADMAGLTLLEEDGRATTAVFTHDTAPEIDSTQYETGEGPCLDAFRHKVVYRVESITAETRWPDFCKTADAKGVKASLSVPLVVQDRGIGGLNFYSRQSHAFTEHDESTGMLFAGQAAIAIANVQAYWGAFELSQQLNEAMESRATIEQAKGVLMAAEGCGPEAAFEILRRASQRSNRKLREIATEIVERASRGKKG